MSAKKIIPLAIVLLVILALAGTAIYYFLSQESESDNSAVTKPKIVEEEDLDIKTSKKTTATQYKILYGKTSNYVGQQTGMGNNCKQLTMLEYKGGGVVNQDSGENQDLDVVGHPLTYLQTKTNDNYYYVASEQSPIQEQYGTKLFDWDLAERDLKTADFAAEESSNVITATAEKFPSYLKTSPDNKYLAYVMTQKKENKFQGDIRNPRVDDSDLVIRDLSSGEDKTVLAGKYNRQLFESFLDFSALDDSLFTIRLAEDGKMEFVKIMLASGEIATFTETFTDFDWSKTLWDELLPSGFVGYPAHFAMSPDETKLMVYKNEAGSSFVECSPAVNYILWSFNLTQNTISTYNEGSGMIDYLDWKNDSQELAYAVISGGGCYPEYLKATIEKMDRDSENKETLVTEDKSKILGLGWSPDDQSIAYGVYSTDLIGWVKVVDPSDKGVEKILSSEDADGLVDSENPVTLNFVDWIEVK